MKNNSIDLVPVQIILILLKVFGGLPISWYLILIPIELVFGLLALIAAFLFLMLILGLFTGNLPIDRRKNK